MKPAIPLLGSLAVVSGCFDPQVGADLECAEGEPRCPSGYECGADERCYPEGSAPPIDAANADALAADAAAPLVTIERISAGGLHTCAGLDSGAVRCWGRGLGGRLGYGNTDNVGDEDTPANAGDVAIGGKVVQLSAAAGHTCALLSSDSVRCWGLGGRGRLGYGNTENVGDDEAPADVGDVDVGGPVKQVEAGGLHTCALLESGAVRCWGSAEFGQLGYGNTEDVGGERTPASVGDVEVGAVVRQLALGSAHTCALLETGAVRCWGRGSEGQLGYGNTDNVGDEDTPESAGNVAIGAAVEQIAAGNEHTCARISDGRVRCWGSGAHGRLGQGNTEDIGDDEFPASVSTIDIGGPVRQIAAGGRHTCALLETGAVRCWGQGEFGQLGYGNTDNVGDEDAPESAGDVDVGGPVRAITAGGAHTCALLESGNVRCWGDGSFGRLGYGNTDSVGDENTPASAGDVPAL